MSKIFIKKPKYPPAVEGLNLLIELLLLIIFIGLSVYITFYPLIIYSVILAIYVLISCILFKKYPEATLFTKDNNLYYYHLNKLTTISFDDINDVKCDEKRDDIFYINYNVAGEVKELRIKNYEAQLLTIELHKTIHKAKNKNKKK